MNLVRVIWASVCLALLVIVVVPAFKRIDPYMPPGRTVTDQTGQEVTIPLPFNGTVPLFQGVGEYLYVTRDPDAILDLQTISLEWLGDSFFFNVYKQLRNLPHTISLLDQQTANQERLLRLNPSAIFVYQTVADPLRRIGLPALGLTQAWSIQQVFDRARVFAQALGQPGRADDLVREFRADMAAIRRDRGDVPLRQQPTVAELCVLPTGLILMIGHAEADQQAFEAACVVNLSPHEHTAKVGVEDSRWQALGAVQQQAVYRRPLGANGGFEGIVEYPLFAPWLAGLTHPDRLAPSLRNDVGRKMRQQFGYPLSDAELDAFLDTSENNLSAAYARFSAHAP